MPDLRNLRKKMQFNGYLIPKDAGAASLEIIPFSKDIFDPEGMLNKESPTIPVQEGGGCGSCAEGCVGGCGMGCMTACAIGGQGPGG